MLLELPHSAHCLVCGPQNPHGLHLSLFVNPTTGIVSTTFTPTKDHIGFENILHGGILMTLADEAMAWSAIWASKRLCLAAELTTRFLSPARPGSPLTITATITSKRPRLLTSHCTLHNAANQLISESTGKFIPLPESQTPTLLNSLLPHPNTAQAVSLLQS
ncbi:MAG TPA: PaaI family thioesterase [Tepidisphaeraceae bacterium]|jgi:uncharacterized protein (TIGR00369 family)|nr:PaaI family thioesterase [Tepidisphaeraceae bacterium]